MTTATTGYYVIHVGATNADLEYIRRDWTREEAVAYADAQQATDARAGAYHVMEDHGFYREDRAVYVSGAAQPAPTTPVVNLTADEKREAKKVAARAKKLASLTIVARATFKATGAQLYAVQSGDKTYHVTRIAGKVRSCADAETGETCQTRQYGNDHCCHGDAVEQMEAKRAEELAVAAQPAAEVLPEMVRHDDLTAHVADALAAQAARIAKVDPRHYLRFCAINGIDPLAVRYDMPMVADSCEGCGQRVKHAGYCHKCAA